ncbi:MAG: hypothetical protein AUJ28_02185 [Parcubacteria group bacterium CG1_02_37_51]|uniref:DNA polymerase III subunit delta n=2 Tax=Candidatus Komeiliibacteriota TaxID=1817908 RepID=A0A2M8DRB9_9BACT|nr:MAG: hypothetical protein AUJ28_02185 [Parcubacteria group bacterium CG1_02_37_51]PIY95333.1 MAG: hypothetical protein COY67_00560 [Candidatus Komeilibacteria bacterium CG_4_10_14_0_8_um_filter_37_78]PJC01933.1 MAG: hypothetical protein CO073_02130 [Candidatus Komeilibacteria bacterium CG_4_9_14_0_8_um_filter_36_9]
MEIKNDQKWPIIGHHNIVSYLQNSVAKKQFVHAYLFSGAESIGKSTVADHFIRSLLCLDKQSGQVDCQCQSCQQYQRHLHSDCFTLSLAEDKKNIPIEQIREWQSALSRKSFLSQYRVGLVNGVEHLSLGAANALLKTIEEPSANTIIILLTHDSNLLLPTIISRSQVIHFKKVIDREIFLGLLDQGIERQTASLITQLAQGLPGKALALSQSADLLSQEKENIVEILNLWQQKLDQKWVFLDNYLKNYEGIAKSKQAQLLLDRMLLIYRELYLIKNNNVDSQFLSNWQEELAKIAQQYEWQKLLSIGDKIFYIKSKWLYNPNPRLMLEDLLLNI